MGCHVDLEVALGGEGLAALPTLEGPLLGVNSLMLEQLCPVAEGLVAEAAAEPLGEAGQCRVVVGHQVEAQVAARLEGLHAQVANQGFSLKKKQTNKCRQL